MFLVSCRSSTAGLPQLLGESYKVFPVSEATEHMKSIVAGFLLLWRFLPKKRSNPT